MAVADRLARTYVLDFAPNFFERWIVVAIAVSGSPMGRTSSKDVCAIRDSTLDPV
jgi:hypothetical protein